MIKRNVINSIGYCVILVIHVHRTYIALTIYWALYFKCLNCFSND